MVEQNGIERYTREILFLGETKGEVNFLEVWCQFKFDVLFSENYLNFDINGKWRKEYAKRYYKRQKERIDKLLPSPSLSKSPKDKD